jgi:hypothetical protein
MVMIMLMGAVAASLAFGVLVAYGICLMMFRAFRFHVVSVAKERTTAGSMQVAIEG